MPHYTTKEQVHARACQAIGKTVKELQENMGIKTSGKKSIVGDAWESWFNVEKNSIAGPDLLEAGVELKATAIIENRNGPRAKERLVLNIIDYIAEFENIGFETSSFWKKNHCMELGFYKYDKEIEVENYKFIFAILMEYPEVDLEIIKQDWELIYSYIKKGLAHEITEGLTRYLGACTKGTTSKDMRPQHPSLNAPLAKQRAYSLKNSYMNQFINDYVYGNLVSDRVKVSPIYSNHADEFAQYFKIKPQVTNVIKDINKLKEKGFDKYILSILNQYIGKSKGELVKLFELDKDVTKSNKALNKILINKMFFENGDLEKTDEFIKAGIQVKTVNLVNGDNKESMSFPNFKFSEIVKESWEDSTLRNMFDSTTYLFCVFNNDIFVGGKFWSMPASDIDGLVKYAWQDTIDKINGELVLMFTDNDKVTNNFIKKSDNMIIHVRPKSQKSSYNKDSNADRLPVKPKWVNKPDVFSNDWMTKQCFFLNNDYVLKQIEDLL